MQVTVTGRHIEITKALREYCENKVAAAAEGYPGLHQVQVILGVEKHRQQAEVVCHVPHAGDIEARDESTDLYASIDAVADKLARQLDKLRGKITEHHKHREKLGEVEARRAQPSS